jgi:RNA polymerase sigma factor (sigma-70 family)
MHTRSAPSGSGDTVLLSHLQEAERIATYVCRRQRLDAADAADFTQHVHLKLLEDDGTVIRQFSGRCSIQTYLSVVIQRLFLDYRRARWGKWRPSIAACRRGPDAVLIERLIARDGHTPSEAYELVTTNHGLTLSRADFDAIVGTLPERTRRRFETDAVLEDVAAPDVQPDRALIREEAESERQQIGVAIREAIAGLPVQDQLVLTMRFDDGRTIAEIALTLRLDQKALYRRVEKLLRELRRQLEASGIDLGVIRDILQIDTSSDERGGKIRWRPSMEKGAPEWR